MSKTLEKIKHNIEHIFKTKKLLQKTLWKAQLQKDYYNITSIKIDAIK